MKRVCADLPDDFEFDERELLILTTAARQADTIADLEKAIKEDGVMIDGAAGQRRLNAAVTELRQGRIAFARLLGELAIPSDEDDGKRVSAASRRGQHAAHARWGRPHRPALAERLNGAA